MAPIELNQMDIYVGNLPYTATEGDVSGLFAAFGPVERVKIITDRETGQSKGFAFVTLGDQSQLNAAIEALNEYDYNGRALRVNASEPKESRPKVAAAAVATKAVVAAAVIAVAAAAVVAVAGKPTFF